MAAFGARAGLGLGAVTCIAVALAGLVALRRLPSGRRGGARTPVFAGGGYSR
jgi:hypothetical protein